MRSIVFLLIAACLVQINPCYAQDAEPFKSGAAFSYGGVAIPQSSLVATIQPSNFSGYFWLLLNFYPYQPTSDDIPDIAKGSTKSMEYGHSMERADPSYKGGATIKFNLDKDFNVTQVDAMVPNHSCTIAGYKILPKDIVQDYRIAGNRVTFKMHGVFPCDVPPGGAQISPIGIDADVDAQVFKVQ